MIRNTNVKGARKPYSSDLRDEQADATRARILDALVRQMGKGLGGLSIPAVAREAGVSIPTVYRHFGSKQGLIDALAGHVSIRAGLMPKVLPRDLPSFEAMAQGLFRNLAAMDQTLRAAMASDLGWEARRAGMPARLGMIRQVIDAIAPDTSEDDRERLTQIALILMATPTFQAYGDYLGLEPDAAASLVGWAVARLVAGTRPGEAR
jgi:AcrR family transcriptional regulator